jgi:hypothetical protein
MSRWSVSSWLNEYEDILKGDLFNTLHIVTLGLYCGSPQQKGLQRFRVAALWLGI